MASYSVRVTGLSTADSPEHWVRLQFVGLGGRQDERYFRSADIVATPSVLFQVASDVGIPLLLQQSKNELLILVDEIVTKAEKDPATRRFLPATRSGWHDRLFVTPVGTYPRDDEAAAFFCPTDIRDSLNYEAKGTATAWCRAFKKDFVGNPLLVFAACLPFMPPFLQFADLEGCIFAFVGRTTRGKTTLLDFAGSGRGGRPSSKHGFRESWLTTPGKLQGLAIQSNETLLLLDDTQNIPGNAYQRAAILREAIYALPSGREKDRLTQSHPPREWRTIVATSSNVSFIDILTQGHVPVDASMGVRYIELPSNDIFVSVPHAYVGPRQFVEAVEAKARARYGSALAKVLAELARRVKPEDGPDAIKAWVKDRIEFLLTQLDLPIGADAEGRVAKYFGLAYAAGLFAIRVGALPIEPKVLRHAIVSVFRSRGADKSPAATDLVGEMRTFIFDREGRFHDQRGPRTKLVRRGGPHRWLCHLRTGGEGIYFHPKAVAASLPTRLSCQTCLRSFA
jgi:putative DNA primase/helicase